MVWKQLLGHQDAERALRMACDLAEQVFVHCPPETNNRTVHDISLVGGSSGMALLFWELSRVLDDDRYAEHAESYLESSFELLAAANALDFWQGAPGVLWVAGLMGALNDDSDDAFVGLLLRALRDQERWGDRLSYHDGLGGVALFCLEHRRSESIEECLALIADIYAANFRLGVEGVEWTRPNAFAGLDSHLNRATQTKTEGRYADWGMANGIPGICVVLARIAAETTYRSKIAECLEEGISSMIRLADASTLSLPVGTVNGLPLDIDGGVCWCYGGLGAGSGLAAASAALGQEAWGLSSIRIAKQALSMTADSSELDGALCHGTAGIAHLCNRMFQATDDEFFKDRASYWLERTVQRYRAGVPMVSRWLPGKWMPIYGLLRGSTGTALALLAASTVVAPVWDRMLLVSTP